MAYKRSYYIYILSNSSGTLYTGVTSDLAKRVTQHVQRSGSKFTSKYQIQRLIYYEVTDRIMVAIQREKEIKSWSRKKKLDLIRALNPEFEDLAESIF